jgi:hypothetical protein
MSAGGPVPDWDESSVFPDSPDPLKAAWNSKVGNEYFNPVSMRSKNRGWKRLEEIDILMSKIRVRMDFDKAKKVRETKIPKSTTNCLMN